MEIWGMGAWVRQGIGPQLVFRQGCGALTETAVAGVSAELLGGRYVFWRAQCLKGYYHGIRDSNFRIPSVNGFYISFPCFS